jgi:phage/plasmid-like protein (TIGR03299 family)
MTTYVEHMRQQNALARTLVDVTGATSISEVLEQADLDWEVSLHDLKYTPGSDMPSVDMPDHFAVARSGLTPLGVVGQRYTPIQNSDAFAPLEYLEREGFISGYDQAGVLGDGQKVFVIATLNKELNVGDPHTNRLLFSTTHDGTGSFNVRAISQRLFCSNQIPRLNSLGKSLGISIRHTQSAQQRMLRVKDLVLAEMRWIDEYQKGYETLLDSPAQGDAVLAFVSMIAPTPVPPATERMVRAAEKKREDILQRIYGSTNSNIRGTWAAAFQGAVEYSDFDARGNNAERILLGRDVAFKREAWDLALQMATR